MSDPPIILIKIDNQIINLELVSSATNIDGFVKVEMGGATCIFEKEQAEIIWQLLCDRAVEVTQCKPQE
ncbi:MAG: hypothetical protein KME17_08110 [Cyanosarcina radialis HA8281-LM2]|jgi:hypothetical protein|nr:hypothetical protein [Cyanosarcina radialis HA8281-LM2]